VAVVEVDESEQHGSEHEMRGTRMRRRRMK
jgi:hypothetical protein